MANHQLKIAVNAGKLKMRGITYIISLMHGLLLQIVEQFGELIQ